MAGRKWLSIHFCGWWSLPCWKVDKVGAFPCITLSSTWEIKTATNYDATPTSLQNREGALMMCWYWYYLCCYSYNYVSTNHCPSIVVYLHVFWKTIGTHYAIFGEQSLLSALLSWAILNCCFHVLSNGQLSRNLLVNNRGHATFRNYALCLNDHYHQKCVQHSLTLISILSLCYIPILQFLDSCSRMH